MHNKVWQKKIAVLLVIAMVLSFMPLAWANTGDAAAGGAGGSTTASSPSALQWSDDTVAVIGSTTYSSLQLAIDAVPQNGSGTITIVKDIEIVGKAIVIAGGKSITLLSDGAHSLNFEQMTDQTACIQVYNGGALTLGTEDDNDNVLTVTSSASGVNIISVSSWNDSNLKFVLNNGILKVAEAGSVRSGIVALWNADFEINGGTIQGNGNSAFVTRGISASGSSTVVMNGGTIKNCVGQYGGGLITNDTASFTMNGGAITNCIGEDGGGIHAAITSTIEMKGGTITQCTARNGSAVYLSSNCSFQMSGGAIIENEVTDTGGASVCVRTGATFSRTGGTIAEQNTVAILETGDMATGYSSLQLAIDTVPQNSSGTIMIVKDIEIVGKAIVIAGGKSITLLSDGAHSLNFEQMTDQTACIQVYNGGALTLGTEDDNDNVLTVTSSASGVNIISVSSWNDSNLKFVLNNGILKVAEAGSAEKWYRGVMECRF